MKKRKLISIMAAVMVSVSLSGCVELDSNQAAIEDVANVEEVEAVVDENLTDASKDTDAIEKAIKEETTSEEELEKELAEEAETITEAEEEEFPANVIPPRYTPNFDGERGTIELITYEAKDYIKNTESVEKKAYVYLPAGYSEDKQYNVLYLMHGIGGNEAEWGLKDEKTSKVKKIMDNMVGNGEIEPFIIVCPNGRAMACEKEDGVQAFYYFGQELRNDLIPYIESHYSTYGGDPTSDAYDMTAARNHRAMAGLSMGGMQTINIGICECLDIISWFGAFSAAPTSYPANQLAKAIDESEYDIDYFYNICGLQDTTAYQSAAAAAKTVDSLTDKLTAGENFCWQEKDGAHNFNIWYLGFYNLARVIFK